MSEFDFRPLELSDREWVNRLLAVSDFRGCLYTFGNNYVWQDVYSAEICRYGDFYLLKNNDHSNGQPRFLYPAGDGDIKGLIAALREYCGGLGVPLLMTANRECTEFLRSLYPEITAEPDRDGFDYVYLSADLAELRGKKYHSKRNHLNRFYENDWSFEPITADNIPECREVLEKWLSSNDMVRTMTGERLKNSVFDIGGGTPCVFGIPLGRKLLGAFYREGEEFEFNFSKFWTHPRTKFQMIELPDQLVWRVKQETRKAVMFVEVRCKKKDMLLIRYQAPDGTCPHTRLCNGGTGTGRIRLYRKDGIYRTLAEDVRIGHVGCEFGVCGNAWKAAGRGRMEGK